MVGEGVRFQRPGFGTLRQAWLWRVSSRRSRVEVKWRSNFLSAAQILRYFKRFADAWSLTLREAAALADMSESMPGSGPGSRVLPEI
jgi:hypothetical protein